MSIDKQRKNKKGFDGGSTQILNAVVPNFNELAKTPTLIILDGTDTGKIFKLTLPVMSIGREDNTNICISDKAVSRKHCLLINTESSITLIDLESSNGTMINGKFIERKQLKNGDKITIGQTILRFEIIDMEVGEYHEKLYKRITFDDLTSLYNRKSMLKELEKLFSNIPKSLPFSLLFLDIDFFKKVNDTYGHITGSKVLTELGRVLLSNLRSIDMACRYGGEEFVVIISQSRSEEAVFVAEKLRKLIENHKFTSHTGEQISLSVSIGIAEATINIKDHQELIDNADKAMYKAKNAGRNKSILFRQGNPPTYAVIK